MDKKLQPWKKKNLSRLLVNLLIVLNLFLASPVATSLASPTPPTPPSAPSAPTPPEASTPPEPPNPTSAPEAPSPEAAPTPPNAPEDEDDEEGKPKPNESKPSPPPEPERKEDDKEGSSNNPNPAQDTTVQNEGLTGQTQTQAPAEKQGTVADGGTGSTTVKTGNVTNSVTALSEANTNITATQTGNGPSASLSNTGNGTRSQNSLSGETTSNTNVNQNNDAQVTNSATLKTITGDNSVSRNTGDATVISGDANSTGSFITALNTNISGVSVSEFNVADDHRGNFILDFPQNCVFGCGSESNALNSGNGNSSENTVDQNLNVNRDISQNNNAAIGSTLALAADSGHNETSQNTSSSSVIKTGDANVSAGGVTFANNNLEGNVLIGVVNIFGNLIGDIILPEEVLAQTPSNGTEMSNLNNGTGSNNSITDGQTLTAANFQSNTAEIGNDLILSSTTGDNQANRNTGSDSVVKTGNADITTNVLNIANSNLNDASGWLVLVNNAGQWVGRILGLNGNSNMAGSEGMQFSVNGEGGVTATNSGNGSSSENSINVFRNDSLNVNQTNTAQIQNTLNLSANTGGNRANQNTGGPSYIQTGDAKIIANLINFVNNNISSGERLVVTIVNVFGGWLGDFVTPGSKKEDSSNNNQENSGNSTTPSASNNSDNLNENPSATNGSDTPLTKENNSTTIPRNTISTGGQTENFSDAKGGEVFKFAKAATRYQSNGRTKGVRVQAFRQTLNGANQKASKPSPGWEEIGLLADSQKTIAVNLAWLVLLLPFILFTWIYRNRDRIWERLVELSHRIGGRRRAAYKI